MSYKLELYLIRHSEPLIEAGVCYGQLDCLLSDDYALQLANISAYFKGQKISAIYSSPLLRCAQLAEDLAKKYTHSEVFYKEAFKEINFGDWEGEKWDDIGKVKIEQWNENRLHFRFPGGESPYLFIQRVLKGYRDLLSVDKKQKTAHKTIILITHAGVIRTLLAEILHLSFTDSLNLPVDKASISLITLKKGISKASFINALPQS